CDLRNLVRCWRQNLSGNSSPREYVTDEHHERVYALGGRPPRRAKVGRVLYPWCRRLACTTDTKGERHGARHRVAHLASRGGLAGTAPYRSPANSCSSRQFSSRSCLACSSVSDGLPSLSKCLAKRPSLRAKSMNETSSPVLGFLYQSSFTAGLP